mmetsp:Transcript_151301/g.263720  ORF Transcript_151301/g.263720 Transcript_151301/m.263720 type:complete len:242 (-) Transcript_151301:710-1435(-)
MTPQLMLRVTARPSSALTQGCFQRGDEILAVFDAAGHADETVGDANLQPVLLQHVSMGHHCASRDNALRRAKVFAQAPWARNAIHELGTSCRAAFDVEPEHSPMKSITVILVGKLLLWEGGQTWVHDFGDLRMFLQKLSDCHRIFALLADTQSHGLCSLQHHVCSEGVHDVAVHILHPLHFLSHLLVFADDSTACHHVVPLIILCQTLDNHVCTMIKRPKDDGCCKGGINHVLGTMLVGDV